MRVVCWMHSRINGWSSTMTPCRKIVYSHALPGHLVPTWTRH